MKDIYELLNEVEMNLDAYEESSLDELYRKKIKKKVQGQIRKRKNTFVQGSKIAIVLLCFLLSTTFISFKVNPTFAMNIPVFGSIIKEITGYGNELFDQYTAVINKTVERDGIRMTLNEVMLDRNQLRVAVTIYNENGDEENFYPILPMVIFNGSVLKSRGGSGTGEYIGPYAFVNVSTLDVHDINMPSNINMKIMYEDFSYLDKNGENKEVKGPWLFEFTISKAAIESKTETYKIERKVVYNDVEMNLKEMTITPLTTHMNYTYRGKSPISFLIKDDKGRVLSEEMSGYGTGNMMDMIFRRNRGEVNFSAVSEGAKELTVIPYYEKLRIDQANRTEPIKYNGELPFILKSDDKNKLAIHNVERRNGKVYINFKTEGILYDIYKYRLYLYNEKNEALNLSDEDKHWVRSFENDEEMLTLVFEDDPTSDLYFETETMADIQIIEAEEFTIELAQ